MMRATAVTLVTTIVVTAVVQTATAQLRVVTYNVAGLNGDLDAMDVTGDGIVDVQDLAEVVLGWGPCRSPCECLPDVTIDGGVDVHDLAEVVLAWGACR